MKGDAVVVMMADASDSPTDAVKYWRLLNDQGYECVFGSRFVKGGKVVDYPKVKLFVNRIANLLAVPWTIMLVAVLLVDESRRYALALASFYYPVFYLAASWWMTIRSRRQ